MCDKIPYETYKEATEAKVNLIKSRGGKYGIYKCDYCGCFHLTTLTKGVLRTPKKLDKYPIKIESIWPVKSKK